MMMLLRIGLFLSLAVIGAALMGAVGGLFLVPKSAGLAGGAMVLGWALLGAVICAVTGLFVTRKFSGRRLAGLTAIVTGIAALLTVLGILRKQQM
ncbi:MAG: hypothetical protein K8I00_11615, partial [Candidatus Omnitrophica bacterium]|nr:hypothetical protein [Candidatus Omnitrophota bacterium]